MEFIILVSFLLMIGISINKANKVKTRIRQREQNAAQIRNQEVSQLRKQHVSQLGKLKLAQLQERRIAEVISQIENKAQRGAPSEKQSLKT